MLNEDRCFQHHLSASELGAGGAPQGDSVDRHLLSSTPLGVSWLNQTKVDLSSKDAKRLL